MKDIFGLEGEPALVVGGGYGSGRETAHLLAQAGARVAVADINGDRARAVAEEVGGIAVVGDVTSAEEATAIVDQAHAGLGGLTRVANIVGLVNMAAFLDTDPAQWEAQIRLNLYSQMFVCQAAGRSHAGGRSAASARLRPRPWRRAWRGPPPRETAWRRSGGEPR